MNFTERMDASILLVSLRKTDAYCLKRVMIVQAHPVSPKARKNYL